MDKDLVRYYSAKKIKKMEEEGIDAYSLAALRVVHDEVENISKEIVDAFDGVQLEDGIGLSQANAMDDYEPKEILMRLRENDEKFDWRKIQSDRLNANCWSLPYFDAKGMRFHLPAFMISDLREEYRFDLVSSVVVSNCFMQEKMKLLSNKQKNAVISYLSFLMKHQDHIFERERIKKSIEIFWSK